MKSIHHLRCTTDGQLLIEGIHDSILRGIRLISDSEISLNVEDDNQGLRDLLIADEKDLSVFGSGQIMPTILNAIFLDPPEGVMSTMVDQESYDKIGNKYHGKSENRWIILLATVYGDPLIIIGSGKFLSIRWSDQL